MPMHRVGLLSLIDFARVWSGRSLSLVSDFGRFMSALSHVTAQSRLGKLSNPSLQKQAWARRQPTGPILQRQASYLYLRHSMLQQSLSPPRLLRGSGILTGAFSKGSNTTKHVGLPTNIDSSLGLQLTLKFGQAHTQSGDARCGKKPAEQANRTPPERVLEFNELSSELRLSAKVGPPMSSRTDCSSLN